MPPQRNLSFEKSFKYLNSLNLNIYINIMQISEIQLDNLKKIISFLKSNNIKILYLADSLGSLTPKKLNYIISKIKYYNWNGELGIHAHNNLKLALKNSLLAIDKNFKWVDCTITGMGRGPGNLKTEDILKFVPNYKITKKFLKSYKKFISLKKIYNWGPNKYYKFAAEKKIHPTYIQKILSNKRYVREDYEKILISLSNNNTKKFNPYKLSNSANFITKEMEGKWSPKNKLFNKNVLILGPGKNLKKILVKLKLLLKKIIYTCWL